MKRLTWAKAKRSGRLVATGVEVLDDEGKSTTVAARKEVVVSAGALRTLLVLEGSGIGTPGKATRNQETRSTGFGDLAAS